MLEKQMNAGDESWSTAIKIAVNLYLDIHILIKTLCLLFNNKISKKSNYDNFEKFK